MLNGHGVGLNVHEGPQSINKINKIKIKEGMILSNEPDIIKNIWNTYRKFSVVSRNNRKLFLKTQWPLSKKILLIITY